MRVIREHRYLFYGAFMTICAMLALACVQSKTHPGMNVLLITLDTTRADRLGCYGDKLAQTPQLDSLAREGIVFERAYTPVPLTLPAHCSLLTGRWPFQHGVRNNGRSMLKDEEKTLAEVLTGRGYQCSALLASYILSAKFNLNQGFFLYDDRLRLTAQVGDMDAEISAAEVYKKYQAWQRIAKQPFFLWLHFFDPHKPYAPPAAFLAGANGDGYRGEIAYVDDTVGKIVADLRQKGMFENTVLVVVGDHGEGFGEHGESGHGIFCYQETLRVPFILYNRRLFPQSKRVQTPVSLIDVMPTVLHLLGLEKDLDHGPSFQGRDLLPLLGKDKREQTDRALYFESFYGRDENNWAPLVGVTVNDWKYISLPEAELYQLNQDPNEKNNLFAQNQETAVDLDAKLKQLLQNQEEQGRPASHQTITAQDKMKLESLGYVSAFSKSSLPGVDPKTGIQWQLIMERLVQELDAGKLQLVEQELNDLFKKPQALNYPYLYTLRGHLLERKKDWLQVEANLQEAIRVFDRSHEQAETFRLNLLEFYVAGKRWVEARKLAVDIQARNPRQAKVYEALARIEQGQDHWESAARQLLTGIRLEPNNINLRLLMVNLLMKQNQWSQANDELAFILENEDAGRNEDILFSAAMVNVQLKELEKAEKYLARIVEINPCGRTYFDYGVMLWKNQKPALAVIQMTIALEKYRSQLTADEIQLAEKIVHKSPRQR